MTGLLLRVRNILVRPQQEWLSIRDENSTYRQVFFGYVAVLAAVPPCAAVLERLLFGARIAGSQPLGYVLATKLLWYLVIMVNVAVTAVVFTFTTSSERRLVDLQGVKLAAYSFTPLFLVSVLTIVPSLDWLIYAAMLYSIYLLTLGIATMTQSGKVKAAWLAAASCLVAGIIVGFLNGLEYMLESFVMGKLFY